MNTSRSCLQ